MAMAPGPPRRRRGSDSAAYDKTARKAYDTRIEVQVHGFDGTGARRGAGADYQTQVSDEGGAWPMKPEVERSGGDHRGAG